LTYEFSVPKAVSGVDEIRVLEWHGDEGAAFDIGDLIVELETHKAIIEVRAGQPGVLRMVHAGPGDWREIGAMLALFSDTADEAIDGPAVENLRVEFEVS
jgi:pyruvate/2-oxoglutarate dehydrogenase complex dihydrolipoamide acyltransferase (E2) component